MLCTRDRGSGGFIIKKRKSAGKNWAKLCAVTLSAMFLLTITPEALGQNVGELGEVGAARYVAGELLVVYETDVSAPVATDLPKEVGGMVEEETPELDTQLLAFPEAKKAPTEEQRKTLLQRKKNELERASAVKSVSYNYIYQGAYTPNDPEFGQQYGLRKIRAPQAWDRVRGSVNVAVVDSGIDSSHPDLQAKIADQRNFVTEPETPDAQDDNGHGTAVAGVAAAVTNNSEGVAGTCPNCGLLIAKSLDANLQGTAQDIADGIVWATDNGAKVINLSLGAIGADSPVLKSSIDYAWDKGVVVAAAAGNFGTNATVYPAAYRNVIAVAATNDKNQRAPFSSYGNWVDVAAPGVNIISTAHSARYAWESGTSFASPHVAGVAGLLASQGRPAPETRKRIESTATDLGSAGKDRFYGRGLVNAAAAVGIRSRSTRNAPPKISRLRPSPGSRIREHTTTVGAIVRDAETDLRKSNISLYVDGRQVRSFGYDRVSNRLSYTVRRLSVGRHVVRVLVRDGQGRRANRKWSFTVKTPQRQRVATKFDSIRDRSFPFNMLPNDHPFLRFLR